MSRLVPPILDIAIGMALVSVGQVEIWTSGEASARDAAIAVVSTLPLIVRRRAPGIVFGICVLAMWIHTFRGMDQFTVAQLLGLMLATYSVAEAFPKRPAVAAFFVVVGTAMANSAAAGRTDPGDYAFPLILLGVPWAAGAASRRWREKNALLRDLTEQLQAERAAHAEAAAAAERGRIARDLHDSLAQSLNAMVVHAEAAQAALTVDPRRSAASLERIQQEGRRSLHQTRHLLGVLREEPEGLRLVDIPRLVANAERGGLSVNLTITGDAERIAHPVQAAVFRIIQESLTNVLKHSSGREASVSVTAAERVRVTVSDNGHDHAEPGRGLGILGMRERASLLGGHLSTNYGPDGFTVTAELPADGVS